jgi:hypothetical protein
MMIAWATTSAQAQSSGIEVELTTAEVLTIVPCSINVIEGVSYSGNLNDCVTGGAGVRAFSPAGTATTPGGGTVTINGDGSYIYTAPAGITSDSIPFTADDGSISTPLPGAVSVVVHPPLQTTSPTLNVPAGSTATGNLNDYAIGGFGPRVFGPVVTNAPTVGGGTITIAPDGSFSYTAPATTGADSFPFSVDDDSVTVPVPGIVAIVVGQAQPLSTISPTLDVPAGSTITGDLNDYVSGGSGPRVFGPAGTVATPGGGSVTINTDGTFSYTAPLTPGTDSFPWTVSDPTVSTPVPGTVNIEVSLVDPLATTSPTLNVPAGTTITGDLNDYVSGGDGPREFGPVGTVTTPDGGSVTINPDGTFSYTAPLTPGTDSFEWTVSDPTVTTPIPGTVNLVITEPLTTTTPTLEVPPGGTIDFDLDQYVSGGFGEREFGPVGTRTTPGGGTITIGADGSCEYTAPTTPGEDTFDWWVIDDSVQEPIPGTVNIVITEPTGTVTPRTPTPDSEEPAATPGSGGTDGGVKLPNTGQSPEGSQSTWMILMTLALVLLATAGVASRKRR